jgi:hydroxymethylbilane synthase
MAERALLAVLGAGCRLPVGALGLPFGGGLRLKGLVAHPDGTRAVRAEATGAQDDPAALGRSVAEALLARGADHLLAGLPAMGPAPEV